MAHAEAQGRGEWLVQELRQRMRHSLLIGDGAAGLARHHHTDFKRLAGELTSVPTLDPQSPTLRLFESKAMRRVHAGYA